MRFFRKDKQFLMLGAGLALILVAAVFRLDYFFAQVEQEQEGTQTEEASAAQEVPENYVRRFSDGVHIPPDEQPSQWYGVMIENSADAWPLSGLSKARLVFEAPVEGQIPRFLAFFDSQQQIEQIGPVRSARPYFIEWARGLNAMYVHVGGSPQALSNLKLQPLASLNQFFFAPYFWREPGRYAPHNVYTSTELLGKGFEEREFSGQKIPSFAYVDEQWNEEQAGNITRVEIPFSSKSDDYTAGWNYDADRKTFQRYQGERPQQDADESNVSASNVVVLYTDVRVIDDVGRRFLRTEGTGEGKLFRDGKQFTITWSKENADAPLRLQSAAGGEAALRAGATWIEVLPAAKTISVRTKS